MAKFLGLNKIGTAVFISGTGSNFKNLINFSFKKKSPIIIKYVISNNFKAKGLSFADKHKIIKKIYRFKKKTKDENEILKNLEKNKIKLICLAGFMQILSNQAVLFLDG